MKILLVEDDEGLLEMLRQVLVSQRYLVECAADGLAAWELAETFDYDLILLDWMLPGLDGISFCQRLRTQASISASTHSSHPNFNTPVILLTAKDSSAEQVLALDAGADDYLVKPIAPEELLARIRALLRRGSGSRSPILVWGNLFLSPDSCEVTCENQRIPLTAKEYEVLELLMRNPQRIFSQGYLLEQLWQTEEMPTESTVRSHIKALRQKLKKAGAADVIETVYGLGYRLQEVVREGGADVEEQEEGEEIKSSQLKIKNSEHPLDLNLKSKIQNPKSSLPPSLPANLVAVWEKYRSHYTERLQVIQMAIAQLAEANLDPVLQARAGREAHTLVGSLGSFNLPQAALLARELEQLFKASSLHHNQASLLSELATTLSHLIQGGTVESQAVQDSGSWGNAKIQSSTPRSQGSKESIPNTTPNLEAISINPNSKLPGSKLDLQMLVVEDDLALATAIQTEAGQWGIQVAIASSPEVAREQMAQALPDGILLDLTFPPMEPGGLELLRDWSYRYPQIPVIVFTAQEGLDERLAVAQAGARMFLQKPIAPEEVMRAISQILQTATPPVASLLIVDDDPVMLSYLQTLLLPWGFQITLLSQPQQFWTILEQTQPDLLILDIEMPDMSGLDLCQVVRNDARWGDLPILILSVHQDADTLTQVFTAGADDYISKPVMGPELIARIANRLQRSYRR